MKKLLMLILTLAMCSCAVLVACSSDEDDTPAADNSWMEQDYGSATVMGPWNQISIFVPDSDAMSDCEPLKASLEEWTGKKVSFLNGYAYPTAHDIVVGYFADREISVKAYELLNRIERESYFEGRFLIYSEAGEIAIAYDRNDVSNLSALDFAVEYFIDNLITDKEYIAYAKGTICSDKIDLIAEQEIIDVQTTADAWNRLAEVASPEIISALKKYYSLYTDSLVDWLANLYAPGKMNIAKGNWAGGFYGAPSGRDTAGFGPDITCTKQVLSLLESTGMLNNIEGGYGQNLPEKMREDILYMLKTLQDPTDGFFYHPQYDKETMLSGGDLQRRGRDLSAAVALFDDLGARPTYNTPTGMMGDGITADEMIGGSETGGLSSGSVTASLGGSREDAVSSIILSSSVILTAEDPTDKMLGSHAGFAEYLTTVKINENSYTWGNQLNAIASQIRSASSKLGKCTDTSSPYYGKTLVDMLFDFLDERIDPTTGMWEGVTTFRATNGFYKVISVYESCKRAFPMPQLAAEGLIAGLLSDQKSTGNICDVYNIWIGLSCLRSNVKNYSTLPAAERQDIINYIDGALARDGAEAILNSYNKYLPYRYDDGSFSDNVGSAAANHNGLPVGLGLAEGDTNATAICVGVVGNIFSCFGWGSYKVPIYTESDWMRFLDIIMELDPVIKYSYLSDDITQDFNSFKDGELESVDNVSYSTGGVSKATVMTEGDNSYVKFEKFGVDNSGRVVVKGSTALSRTNTVTVQFKMNVLESNNQRISVAINKYNMDATLSTIYFTANGNKLRYDSVSGWGDTGISLGEWFTVKVVYYEGSDSCPLYIKVYINNVLMDIKTTTSKSVSAKQVGAVSMVPLYAWKGVLLYDDVSIIRSNETPDPSGDPVFKPIVIPDYDYATEDGVHTFDKVADGVIPSGCQEDYFSWSDGGVSEAKIVTDGENKYFYFDKSKTEQSGSASFKFDKGAEEANVLTAKAKMYVESGRGGRMSFVLKNASGDSIKTFYFQISGNALQFETVNGWLSTGAAIGSWVDLTFKYYEGDSAENVYIATYVNGVLIDVDKSATKDIKAESLTTLTFVPLYAFLGKVRLDDISLTRAVESYSIGSLPMPDPSKIPSTPTPENPNPDNPTPDNPTPDNPTPDAPAEPEDTPFKTTEGVHKLDFAEVGAVDSGYSDSYFSFSGGNVCTAAVVQVGENKYFELTKPTNQSGGSASFMFSASSSSEKHLSVSFDIKIESNSGSGRLGINLYAGSNSQYLTRLFLRKDGSAIQYEGSGGWTTFSGVKPGDWFNVRIDYCEGEAGDGTDALIKVFINGIKVIEKSTLDNFKTAASINRISIVPLQAWTGTAGIDNISLARSAEAFEEPEQPHVHEFVDGKCECGEEAPHEHEFVNGKCECGEEDPSYVPEAPHEHEYVNGKCECGELDPAHEHSYTEGVCVCGEKDPSYVPPKDAFETTDGVHKLDYATVGAIESGYNDSYFEYSSGNVSTAAVVQEGENKYVSYTKNEVNASGSVSFKFASGAANEPYLSTSFDLMIDASSNNQRIGINLYAGSSSQYLTRLFIRKDGSAIQYEGSDGWTTFAGLKSGEWFNVRIDYYEGEAGDGTGALLKVFINNVKVIEKSTLDNFKTAQTINKVTLLPLNGWKGTVSIDNVSLARSAEAFEEPEQPHVHEFVDGKCECGEEAPHEHEFVNGKCECGEEDPSYVPEAPHEHEYVNGKCECGELDPAHEHSYTEGVCVCGEKDPSYVPPKDAFEATDGVYSFDYATDGSIAGGYSDDYIAFTDRGVSSASVVTEGENKFVQFVKSGVDASGTVTAKFERNAEATNVLTLSLKMRIVSANGQRISFTITDSNSTPLKTFYFNASGRNVQFVDNTGAWISTGAFVGEWIDIKVVYYEGATVDGVYNCYIGTYINGTLIDVCRSATKVVATDSIVKFNFIPLNAWLGTVDLDDISLVRANEVYDLNTLPEVGPATDAEADAE